MRPGRGTRPWAAAVAVGLLAFAGAAAGIPVRAAHGAQTTADEPQYLLTAISLAEDRDLDVADELAARRWRAFHAAPLPEQTRPLASGRRLSPHDPLLPLLLAAPVAAGGWVGAKLAMAALAGLLAGLLLWTAVRRFGVPVGVATLAVAAFALSPPLAVYGSQLYPELPAAIAVVAAVAALTAPARPAAPGKPPVAAPTGAAAAAPTRPPVRSEAGAPGAGPSAPLAAAAPAAPPVAAGPAAWADRAGAGGLAGPPGGGAVVVVGVAVAALPWLAVKYVPVAAVLGLLALWRLAGAGARRRALALAAGLAAAAVAFFVLHRWWYGGWTPYAAGDHFVGGELTAVGTDPDYLCRSRRLLGLATDRSFGVAAWQPAWLLAVPALATLARRRPPGWAAVTLPLAAGWLVATFVALTMHGWWSPGRQVVVVLPLAVLAVAWWAGVDGRPAGTTAGLAAVAAGGTAAGDPGAEARPPAGAVAAVAGRAAVPGRRVAALAVAGGLGVVAYGWLLADGLAGRVTWAVDFFRTGNPAYRAWRLLLPDYLAVTWATWALHAAWLVVLTAWAAAAWRRAGAAAVGTPRPGGPPRGAGGPRGRAAGWTVPSSRA
jgi:hypothetical protein